MAGYETRIKELKDRVKAFPSTNDIVNAIRTGRFNTVKDIINLVPIATELPLFAEGARTGLEDLKEYDLTYGDYAYVAHESHQRLASFDFEAELPEEFDGSSDSDNALVELKAIQDMLRDELGSTLSTFNKGIIGLGKTLAKFSLARDTFRFETGTSTFKRWSVSAAMDLPYSKLVTKTYKKCGLARRSNKYRQFWKCRSTSQTVYHPDRHVPYIRFID
ncbi:hypothetical protein ACJ41O_000007 [Fusarium nematophilum]